MATIWEGAGPPSSGLGNNGDWYKDLTAEQYYGPKTAGAWGDPTPFGTGIVWCVVLIDGRDIEPETFPTPTITDPQGEMATGPYFIVTSADGTVGIKADGNTIDLSADLGPKIPFCFKLWDDTERCIMIPAAWVISEEECDGESEYKGSYWYCLIPPTNVSLKCGKCSVTSDEYCIVYGQFDPDFAEEGGCTAFSDASEQTVTRESPCTWLW